LVTLYTGAGLPGLQGRELTLAMGRPDGLPMAKPKKGSWANPMAPFEFWGSWVSIRLPKGHKKWKEEEKGEGA